MLYTASVSETRNMFSADIQEAWIVVRSMKNPVQVKIGGIGIPTFHVPLLSPSWALFKDYLEWKKAGEWDEAKFQAEYVPRFLQEMKGQAQQQALNTLFQKSRTANILCLCYCQDPSTCHRSILQGLVKGASIATGKELAGEAGDQRYFTDYKALS